MQDLILSLYDVTFHLEGFMMLYAFETFIFVNSWTEMDIKANVKALPLAEANRPIKSFFEWYSFLSRIFAGNKHILFLRLKFRSGISKC